MNILITGSDGFIGRNMVAWLTRDPNNRLLRFDAGDHADALKQAAAVADIVFHFAGVNRPRSEDEFRRGNAELTAELCGYLEKRTPRPRIVFSSSTQAQLENPYGRSKRAAEARVLAYTESAPRAGVIFRLPNVFGKWGRPHYNSAVATFCHCITRDLPIEISDESHVLELAYIDDVVQCFAGEIGSESTVPFRDVTPTYRRTLGQLVEKLRQFRAIRDTGSLPAFDEFDHKLYATYLSHLDPGSLSYALNQRSDHRGVLAEFIRTDGAGQIFVSRTKPGTTRGNHYHHTKTEKFLVLEGEAVVRLRRLFDQQVVEVQVNGNDLIVVDIPPGYTHSIENIGAGDLVTLFWASQAFDPHAPDTYALEVASPSLPQGVRVDL